MRVLQILDERLCLDVTKLDKRVKNLTGKEYGRLTVLGLARRVPKELPNGNFYNWYYWHCLCSCGSFCEVSSNMLRRGTESCGCLQRERTSQANTTHGQARPRSHTRAYNIWLEMLKRCGPANRNPIYDGVYLDPSWLEFENFFEDMGECPEGLSIDRIKAEVGYRPGNCRWATAREQAINRKTTRWYSYQGRTLCIMDWAREYGVAYSMLKQRLDRGWPIGLALTQPAKDNGKR